MPELLRIRDLEVSFGLPGQDRIPALDGISFSIGHGEAVGVVGESGSGKTLTALAIMRLLPRQKDIRYSGQIRFHPNNWKECRDLMAVPEGELRSIRGHHISMVFQEPMRSLHPVYRCGDQIREVLRRHKISREGKEKELVLHWLERMQLRDPERIFNSYPHQLSGGQKQRVMLAMALCTEPDLLLADEPTTALDVTVQKEFLDLLSSLREELGLSILFISHDLGVVHHLCDRIIVMRKGKIVEEGPTRQIFEFPESNYTLGLLYCRPPVDRTVGRLPILDDQLEEVPVFEDISPVEPEPAQTDGQPLVGVKELQVVFSTRKNWWSPVVNVRALDGVSLEIGPGETLGVVGESGSGKTTLARCILGLQEYQQGTVFFQGQPMEKASRFTWLDFRRKVQAVFQDPFSSLQPRMAIGEAIGEPLRVHFGLSARREKERVLELLDQVGMSARHYDRYPHEFSGGQRQRLAIARALALEPRLLICDESVSSLDVSIQAVILNLLKDLQEQFGLSLMFITHDLSVVRFLCQRVLVMYRGRVEEEGPVDDLFERPRSPYTRKLLAAIPN